MTNSRRLPDSPLPMPAAATALPVVRWRGSAAPTSASDALAAEVPVALEFNGIAYATMLATPADLDDFARGFALTEGVVQRLDEIYGIDLTSTADGVVVQLEIASARAAALRERRRALAGRTGCGVCGVESLPQVLRPVPAVAHPPRVAMAAVLAAQAGLQARQPLHQHTGATHAAGLAGPDGTLWCVREDVGRHNALDKLIGATAGQVEPGWVVVSSRASFEMVHKTLAAGHVLLAAVSAPTTLAQKLAHDHHLILMGFVRGDRATVYAGADRVDP